MAGLFFQESFGSSVDFPTYIPWQTLSSDLSDKLKHGSIRINRSNKVEYTTIQEEGTPLIENGKGPGPDVDGGSLSSAVKGDFTAHQCRGFAPHSVSLRKGYGTVPSPCGIIFPALLGKISVTGTSWPAASFLLVNAALGAGVLNYPFAYDKAGGIYFAMFLQLVLQVLLVSTMLVLVYCADLNYDNTYHDVLLSMCGRKAQQFSAISIMLTCYGICITFLIIIGDQYDRLFLSLFGEEFDSYFYLDRKFTISATAVLFIWPMCYFHRLDFLRYASTLGIFAMLYPVFLTVYEYYKIDVVPGPIKTMPDSFIQVMVVIPVLLFAYQTHEIVVPVYACMRNRNLKDFSKATFLAMGILLFTYCITGSFGYLTFGSHVAADIMAQYDARDPVVLIGIGALVVKMVTTYPQLVLCGRGALDGLYAEWAKLTTDQFITGEPKRRIIVTSLWFITSVLLAVLTPNIGIVIELLGCLASVNIFVFPGLCLIALVFKNDPNIENSLSYFLLALAVTVISFGAFVFGVVFMQVIIVDIKSGGASPPRLTFS